ncbi:MAG: sugar ABC transporter substrate-binding protein [Sphaerochaeta sp.]|jgi:multiple sugar transport system substrate-binding protein|uniref:ABC transporter substrate-binding protein n=1 Tax=unclassified Sphaerochaeta TaxID=2637943 RepID=UPI000A5B8FBD|nr:MULTISPECIES: sugar ABC transporter substrate-binding protein [unclassified Sphaerochaeta]MDX9824028.1 sugar ABC transporter substrate-binding protein [Sphaerochaeta sp.]HPE92364.1 sugar ABC transporter substrate-binding protein [Sphaerochaeta sp.]
MKRTLLVLLGLVMILATVGAQGSQEPQKSGPVTLKYAFWGNPDAIGVEQDIIKAFEEKHPDIKIEPIVSGYADYHTKLMTMIAGNMAPDVMRIDDYYFYDFIKLGAVESLSPYIQRDKIDLNLYPKMGIEEATVDGQIYGLPWGTAPLYMLLNLDVFEKAGVALPSLDWTTKDFERIVRSFNPQKDKVYGFAIDTNYLSSVLPHIWSKGGTLLSEDKSRYTGDSPEASSAIQMLADLYKEGYMPKDTINSGNTEALRRWFSNGTIAMMSGSAQEILAIQKIEGIRFEAWTMPQAMNSKNTTVFKSNTISISKSSKQKEAAWIFTKFLRGVEGEDLYVRAKRFPPTLNIAENWALYLDPNLYPKQIKQNSELIAKEYGHTLPLRTGYAAIESKVIPAVQSAMLGTKTAAQAMADIRGDITKIIETNSK